MLFFSRKRTLLSFILLLLTSSLAPSSSAAYRPLYFDGDNERTFDASVIVTSEQGRKNRNKKEAVSDSHGNANLYTMSWVLGLACLSYLISKLVSYQPSSKKITA